MEKYEKLINRAIAMENAYTLFKISSRCLCPTKAVKRLLVVILKTHHTVLQFVERVSLLKHIQKVKRYCSIGCGS